ncbi:hypothetical protein [Plantactinospora sonchi]|uniref:DUF3618 domain-containing protein n=1 Tax=Plantactinospora sonchi TaxID=1544735 RepID=A0ABU7S0L1_9ACTN
MLGTNLLKQRKPERVTDQAWDYLTSSVNSAGESVRDTARSARRTSAHLTGQAGDRVGAVADEAMHRASRAYDALAGRRPSLPWGWLAVAGLVGAAVAWAATTTARAALARAENELPATDHLELVDVDRPNSPVRLDTTN